MKISNDFKLKYLWDENNPSGYYNRMGKYKTKIEYEFIKKHLKGKNILDIGGGSGRFALPIIKMGYDVTVVDLDKDAIELCKQKGITKAICVDIRDFYQNNFEVVIAIELFLVTPPNDILKTANKLLSDNGVLIFTGTNKTSWRYKLHNLRKNKSYNYGELSLDEYRNLIEANGFRIIDIKGFNWMPFRVNSNIPLVPLFAKLESFFSLEKWLIQSPWFLFACSKY